MDRCDGCAPLKGSEAGTVIEARYPGILALSGMKETYPAQAGPTSL
jgi:hypothetical protein